MNPLYYACLQIFRKRKNTAITLLSYVVLLSLVTLVQHSLSSRQDALNQMVKTIPVQCVIADPTGQNTHKLRMPETYYYAFTEESPYSPYIRNVSIRSSASYSIGANTGHLIGITNVQADYHTKYNRIIYSEGQDEHIFQTDLPLCIITSDLLSETFLDQQGIRWLDIEGIFETYQITGRIAKKSFLFIPLRLQVMGVTMGEKSIHCPFYFLYHLRTTDYPRMELFADAVSFEIADNSRIDEFRTLAAQVYTPIDETHPDPYKQYGMLFQDAYYIQCTREAARSLRIMQLLQPVLYGCAIAAGIFLAMLQIRGRRKEIAILRSMGSGKLHVALCFILEYTLLCLPLSCCSFLFIGYSVTALEIFLSFILGAGGFILHFMSIPLARQLRELEEER